MGESASDHYLVQLARKRAPAMDVARVLIERGEYEQARVIVRKADDSIYADVALAQLLEDHLRALATAQPPTSAQRLRVAFEHAMSVAQHAYPDPHTRMEADDFARWRAEDHARLVNILGYDPTR